jgi:hypothetical protein
MLISKVLLDKWQNASKNFKKKLKKVRQEKNCFPVSFFRAFVKDILQVWNQHKILDIFLASLFKVLLIYSYYTRYYKKGIWLS